MRLTKKSISTSRASSPPESEKDILRFLAEHAPDLEDWQRDIIMIVREEMLYFLPQMQTKVLNEGWASAFWHARTMREMDLTDAEATMFAQMHAGVLAPSRTHLNPYHLGFKILEDIEQRWDHPTKEEHERWGANPARGAPSSLRCANWRTMFPSCATT